MSRHPLNVLLILLLASLPWHAFAADLGLPEALDGKAQILLDQAVMPPGQGGVSAGLVVILSEDIPVYRLWSGPDKKSPAGFTNRFGRWWSYDAPTGTQAAYREHYDICTSWNDLTWVATCTLKKGAVVVIGPGQSVSAETCGDPTGQESYPAQPDYWQTYVPNPYPNSDGSPNPTLVCPPESDDYPADPNDIAKPIGQ